MVRDGYLRLPLTVRLVDTPSGVHPMLCDADGFTLPHQMTTHWDDPGAGGVQSITVKFAVHERLVRPDPEPGRIRD
jgi:hypothetical protein